MSFLQHAVHSISTDHRCGQTKTCLYPEADILIVYPLADLVIRARNQGRWKNVLCPHQPNLLKMQRLPLRSTSASSPSRIHWFTTCHTARKSLGLSLFCFINRSVSWDPCSWVEPSAETPGGPAPAPADSSPPRELTSDSTLLFVSSCA